MDTTSDMLTIIRNAGASRLPSVKVPYSRMNFSIAEILRASGWVKNVDLKKRGEKSWITLELAYRDDGTALIQGAQKISTQGKRIYRTHTKIPAVKYGYGMAILSTSKGVMSAKEAKRLKVGGEVLCKIW
jgi:small subunit ribosomal protein S8